MPKYPCDLILEKGFFIQVEFSVCRVDKAILSGIKVIRGKAFYGKQSGISYRAENDECIGRPSAGKRTGCQHSAKLPWLDRSQFLIRNMSVVEKDCARLFFEKIKYMPTYETRGTHEIFMGSSC
jgi:hypothetical protein